MKSVQIGNVLVGPGQPCAIIGEAGLNANGSVENAKKLITLAHSAGCNFVKWQKRTLDVVYTQEELGRPRESPFGKTNGDLKRALEFGLDQYQEIDRYCREIKMPWFASCWDEASVDFINQFDPPCYKIASASLTDHDLLSYTRAKGKPIILSTGMSTLKQICDAVEVLGRHDLILLHATSTYPAEYAELNLRTIGTLREYFDVPIGFSGHETGLATSVAAVALGAVMLERHISLDRSSFGSDQSASLGPRGIETLCRDVRLVEAALGDGVKRVFDSEIPVMRKLRRIVSPPL